MDISASPDYWALAGALVMREFIVVSSDSALRESIIEALPPDVTMRAEDGELESIVEAIRSGAIDIVWDLAAQWLSPQVLLGLLQPEQLDRCRWFWLRREQTRWEDIPEFGHSLLLPMSSELIVSTVYPRRQGLEPEIRGEFEILSLPDLLQTLAMNQRDVRVTLNFAGETGFIELRSGHLADVEFRGHRGMKAMCRLLEEKGGSFSMTEIVGSVEQQLISSVNEALMMAIQFKDEKLNLLTETFPDPRVTLNRSDTVSCPVGEQTKEFEIWSLLKTEKTLRSLMETSELPDAMVLKVLRDWVEVGAVKETSAEKSGVVFLSAALERRLKTEFQGKRSRDLVSVCATAADLEKVRESWQEIDGYVEDSNWDSDDAIVELGTLLHYDRKKRYPVVCWIEERGDLAPWARWRAQNSVFLVHEGCANSPLGTAILGHSDFLATRDVGFSGIALLRGLERTVARLT